MERRGPGIPVVPPVVARWHGVFLLALLTTAGTPYLWRLPPATVLFVLTIMGWCGYALWRQGALPTPSRTMRAVLVVAMILALRLSPAGVLSRETGVGLLLATLILKLLEIQSLRDIYFLTLWSFFLTMGHVLFSQNLLLATYMAGCMAGGLVFLMLLARAPGNPRPLSGALPLALTLAWQAVPVMVLLFLFFPRLPGPLLTLPREVLPRQGVSGLSEVMEPGAIGQLTLSDQVAFRVQFQGEVPAAIWRYWRGPVLWTFTGRSWRTAPLAESATTGATSLASPVHYRVTLEPHRQHWLFALDLPGDPPADASRSADHQWRANQPVDGLRHYEATSYLRYHMEPQLPAEQRRMGLQLPRQGNPRARQLATQWATDQGGNAKQVVATALDHFHRQPFYYTLTPPLLDKDPVDGFLFTTRRGFCEHYAGAFVFLMRAAGIPARVVTGYLGGEINPFDGHMTVRQADAHGWAEVWLAGEGWLRVDPTSAVAPERVERDSSRAAGVLHGEQDTTRESWPWFLDPWRIWDAVDNRWNLWILGYGRERQTELFSQFGLEGSWRELAVAMVVSVAAALAALASYLWWRQRRWWRQGEPVVRHYNHFCHRLAGLGFERAAHEGALDFAARVAAAQPDWADWLWRVTRLYIGLRYDQQGTKGDVQRLRQLVRQQKIG